MSTVFLTYIVGRFSYAKSVKIRYNKKNMLIAKLITKKKRKNHDQKRGL